MFFLFNWLVSALVTIIASLSIDGLVEEDSSMQSSDCGRFSEVAEGGDDSRRCFSAMAETAGHVATTVTMPSVRLSAVNP